MSVRSVPDREQAATSDRAPAAGNVTSNVPAGQPAVGTRSIDAEGGGGGGGGGGGVVGPGGVPGDATSEPPQPTSASEATPANIRRRKFVAFPIILFPRYVFIHVKNSRADPRLLTLFWHIVLTVFEHLGDGYNTPEGASVWCGFASVLRQRYRRKRKNFTRGSGAKILIVTIGFGARKAYIANRRNWRLN